MIIMIIMIIMVIIIMIIIMIMIMIMIMTMIMIMIMIIISTVSRHTQNLHRLRTALAINNKIFGGNPLGLGVE